MNNKMEPWTKEDFEKFKALVCSENICAHCSDCDKCEAAILGCFDDLTSDPSCRRVNKMIGKCDFCKKEGYLKIGRNSTKIPAEILDLNAPCPLTGKCETCGASADSSKGGVILCKKCKTHLDTFGYVMNESGGK